MQLSDFAVSLIRTWVPAAAGAVIAYFVSLGVDFSTEQEAAISSAVVVFFVAIYYWAARALESRWPAFGYLLGVAKTPSYPDT